MKASSATTLAFLLFAALCGLGCQKPTGTGANQNSGPTGQGEQVHALSEHRVSPTMHAPDKALGDDCTTHGASECLSHLCLHVGGRDKGYVCSQSCSENASCPTRWRCRSMSLSASQPVCVPPSPEKKS